MQQSFLDVSTLIDKESGQPFDPFPNLSLMVYNIIASMVFGKTWVWGVLDVRSAYPHVDIPNIRVTIGISALTRVLYFFNYNRHHKGSRPFTVYPKKYAHGFVVLCFVVVMQSFIMNSHEVFINIHQGCFAGTGAIVRLPQCQWSKPEGYGKISQCITTTKHSKTKTVCIFLGIYCRTLGILSNHW